MKLVKLATNETIDDIYFIPEVFTKENCEHVARYCLDNGYKMHIEFNQVMDYFKEANEIRTN